MYQSPRSEVKHCFGFLMTLVKTVAVIGTVWGLAACGGSSGDSAVNTPVRATLVSIAITPANPTLSVAMTANLTATATYSDSTTQNVTATATWATSDTAIATASVAGVVTGVAAGAANITASLRGVTSSAATVNVTTATLASINVTPASPSVSQGLTQQYTATGTFSDASTADISSSVIWSSNNTAIATVNTAGLASTLAQGAATISATYGIVSATASITVTAPVSISATATTTAQNLTVGTAMTSFTPLVASGGTTPYTYSYTGTLPAGLSYNASTGAVTGTPTAVYAAANLVFSVKDANNVVASTTSTVSFTVGAAAAAAVAAASTLNDTGITASQCYQVGSATLVACNSAGALALSNAQDGMAGRDANTATNGNTDGKLGFSFSAVTGGCVQDNVTGLMWEVKTADGGLRDWTKTYTNYSAIHIQFNPSDYGTATDTSGFVIAVNVTNLCGHSDWRLPTADELQSIVNYGVGFPGPTIDTSWFPNTQGKDYWTVSPEATTSWVGSFYKGVFSTTSDSNSTYVRLVRAGQTLITSRYTVSGDGQEVTDNQTKLIWQRCAEGMSWDGSTCVGTAGIFTHEAALQHAAAKAGSTGVAWRLPNVKELTSITDKSRSHPAIDSTVFPANPTGYFLSASPQIGLSSFAWVVSFSSGVVLTSSRTGSIYINNVRLVRSGQ